MRELEKNLDKAVSQEGPTEGHKLREDNLSPRNNKGKFKEFSSGQRKKRNEFIRTGERTFVKNYLQAVKVERGAP